MLAKFIANPEAYVKTEEAASVSTSTAGCCGSTPKETEKKTSCCEPKPETEADSKASCCAPKPKAETAKSSCCGGGKHQNEHPTPSGSSTFT